MQISDYSGLRESDIIKLQAAKKKKEVIILRGLLTFF